MNMKCDSQPENVVKDYFELIRELRGGNEDVVEKILSLWDEDGIFEFCGAPPVTGIYKGKVALATLYKNRAKATNMPLRLEGSEKKGSASKEAALGIVDTEVGKVRVKENKVFAGWQTVIGTEDGRGFQVSGSHTFTFIEGRISSLKIVISPKPDVSANLRLEDLTINDIGRLALAAWPVV